MLATRRLARVFTVASLLGAAALPAIASGDPGPAALPPQLVLEVPIAGPAGVPHDAAGAIVNLTVTNPAGAGFATVFSCAAGVPGTSNLNYPANTDRANTVLAPLSPDGSICVATSATTDVIVDVFGFVPAGSPIELLDPAVRGVDTRSGLGTGTAGPVAAGSTLVFDVSKVPGVGDAGAVALNVTSVGPPSPGFVTVAPCNVATPSTSTLNHLPGRDVANLAITAVAPDGTVCITTNVATHLVIDVAARIPTGAVDPVLLASARRAVDSRLGIGTTATQWAAGETRPLDIDEPGVPADAMTGFVNLTATRAAAAGFVSIHRCGTAPRGSNLNFTVGSDVANAAFVRLDPGRSFCATASAPVDLIVDVVGAASKKGTLVTFDSVRVYDSRAEARTSCGLGLALPAPDTLWVVDLKTGALAAAITDGALRSWTFLKSRSLPALITPTCDELIVTAAKDATQQRARVLRVGFDGSIVELAEIDAVNFLPPLIQLLADGTPVRVDDHELSGSMPPEILPLVGGVPIFTGEVGDRIMSVLHDDHVALLRSGGTGQIWALIPIDGSVASATGPVEGQSLSPGGTYQLLQPHVDDDVIEVTTLDGATVVMRDLTALTAPDRSSWSGVWIDDGLVVLCAVGLDGTPTRSFVWNVFSEPVEVPVAACVFDGR